MKKLGYLYVGFTLLAFFSGFGFTQRNVKDITSYVNPATELNQYEPDSQGGFRERRLEGRFARSGNGYVLLIPGLMTSGDDLRLEFPATPKSDNSQELRSSYASAGVSAEPQNERRVAVQLQGGIYDNSSNAEGKMGFRDGFPDGLLLGTYWDLNSYDNEWVSYHLSYQVGAERRYATVSTEARLPWMKRSRARLAAYYLRFFYTVPLDVMTSPYQLLVFLVAPRWPS